MELETLSAGRDDVSRKSKRAQIPPAGDRRYRQDLEYICGGYVVCLCLQDPQN